MRVVFFSSVLVLSGCPGIGSEDTSVLTAIPDYPAYDDIAQITATYCLRCHNVTNPQGDFAGDTYESLYKERKIAEGEVDQGRMPPLSEAPMSKIDRATFLKWVRQGAPETVPDEDDGASTDDDGASDDGDPDGGDSSGGD